MTGQLAYIAREMQRQEQLAQAAHQRLAATAARPPRRRLVPQVRVAVGARRVLRLA